MDALLLRSLQSYVLDTFGATRWLVICRAADLPVTTFEPLRLYAAGLADQVAMVAAGVLGRPAEAIWEDVGTYLVTNPDREGVRRLLRFAGVSFADFLVSLEELPGRARLVLPDLDLPEITLTETGPDRFELTCQSPLRATLRVMVGILTAMADDYGALCLIEAEDSDRIRVSILDSRHTTAKAFDLALQER